MSEPVIEVIRPCEHGELEEYRCYRLLPDGSRCYGGDSVRYTRQEAIELIREDFVDRPVLHEMSPSGEVVEVRTQFIAEDAVDALLGETDV
jgi:hypothetical protein